MYHLHNSQHIQSHFNNIVFSYLILRKRYKKKIFKREIININIYHNHRKAKMKQCVRGEKTFF